MTTLEQLSAAATKAIKTTGYKYFGDYELSEDQWEAVDALVEFARVVTYQLRTGQLVAVQPDDATVERVTNSRHVYERRFTVRFSENDFITFDDAIAAMKGPKP